MKRKPYGEETIDYEISIATHIYTFLLLFAKSSSAVYVDSAYVYSQYYNADSSRFFLVAKVHLGSTPCGILDTSVTTYASSIQVDLCYIGGTALVTCNSIDVIDLGIRENGLTNILAVFKEYYNGQCRSSVLYKDSFMFTINTTNTDIISLNDEVFILSPNPTTNKLSIQLANGPSAKLVYQILSTDGRMLMQNTITQPNFEIDVSSLCEGLYFLQLQNDKQRWVKKFVKE